ncbi:MAG: MBL fold metallo-hydrolase [Anaerolineae bacterium]
MRQLADRLWWVDELAPAAGVYVWKAEDSLYLFDAGMPWQGRKLLRSLETLGWPRVPLSHLFITHIDFDHIGGARTVLEATGASLVCHAVTAAMLQGRIQRRGGKGVVGRLLPVAGRLLSGPLFHVVPLRAELLAMDGDPLPGGFRAVYTPGHCAGHLCYHHPDFRVLIVGDALQSNGQRVSLPPAMFTADPEAAARNVGKLARLDVEIACFGHGQPITQGAGEAIRTLAEQIGQAPDR